MKNSYCKKYELQINMRLNLSFDKKSINAAKIDELVGTINFIDDGKKLSLQPTYILVVEGMKEEQLEWVSKAAHYFVEMCKNVILIVDGEMFVHNIPEKIKTLKNSKMNLEYAFGVAEDIVGLVNLIVFSDKIDIKQITTGSHVSLHSFCFRRKPQVFSKGGGISYYVQLLRMVPYDLLDQIMNVTSTNVVVHLMARPGCRIVNIYTKHEMFEQTRMKNYIIRFGNTFEKQKFTIPVKLSIDRTIGTGTQFLLDVKIIHKDQNDFKETWELLTVERTL